MSAELELARLEAKVLATSDIRVYLRRTEILRQLLTLEGADIRRVVLAMSSPRVEAQALAAVLDAFGAGARDALGILESMGIDDIARIGRPSIEAKRLVTGLDKAGREALATAQKLARAGADPQAVTAPIFAHANRIKGRVTAAVNMSGNEGSTAIADAADLPTVWVSETNACVRCLKYSGMVAKPGKTFPGGLTYGKPVPAPPLKHPPLHPHCLPFDAVVTPGSHVTGASARMYDGQMVRVQTLLGNNLTGTPNHPVLTRRGWVGLGLLQPGDEVVSRLGEQRVINRGDDSQHVPTLIGELAQTTLGALKMAAREMPLAPVDFHGDGIGSEVGVIATDSLLRDMLDAPFCEHHREELFDVAARRGLALPSEGDACEPFFGDGRTSHSGVGGARPRGPLLRRSAGHTESMGGLATTSLDARFGEASSDDTATDTNSVGDALLALSRLVSRDDGGAVNGDAARRHGAPLATIAGSPTGYGVALEKGEYAGLSDAEAIADVLRALPGEVTLDSVISVDRYGFHGMVYNLETVGGWYVANGIITHNCRCTVEPLQSTEYADALRREADRSVLRGFSLESESMGTRIDAADRLLSTDPTAPKSVVAYSKRAVKAGKFPTRGR